PVHAFPKFLKIFRINRVDSRKHHGLDLFKSLDGFPAGAGYMGDGIPYFYFPRLLDAGNNVAYIARADNIFRHLVEFQGTDLIGYIFLAGRDKLHLVAFANFSVLDLEVGHNTPKRIEYRVEDQRL